ncbi:alpha-sarcoglycan [Electrophorus electricus]|uniref:Dystroglycan-type cadherin-like domain-containing protein n=1 Tax=Electrophorus electricus TaxID=8005 RepID=A0A4W4E8Y5_ELEEL|nr:alpha-sarcoglycan [Electrophorus electricus]
MADRGYWALALTAFVSSLLVVQADIIKHTPVGQLFVHKLEREKFQNEFEPFLKIYGGRVYNDPMVFKCNRQQFPDLPRWLRFTQRHPYDNGFLYGTPLQENLGKNIIEIFVTNKRSYETFKDRLVINVAPAVKPMPYQAEFFIGKREIEKVLPSDVQEEIKNDIKIIWGTDSLHFVNITSALDRGGRVPLPLAGHYEGVYVKLGSDKPYSTCLLSLQTLEHQRECEVGGKISEYCSRCNNPANCVTWCRSTLIDLSRPVPPAPLPTVGSGILAWGGEFDPPVSPPAKNYIPDYIVTIIIPFVFAIVLALILAYVMCCRREGVQKRDAMTPELQLYHHHTIQGNSSELRNMAQSRGSVPQPLSTLPMFNTRTGERAPPDYPSESIHIPLIMAQQEPNVDTLPRK